MGIACQGSFPHHSAFAISSPYSSLPPFPQRLVTRHFPCPPRCIACAGGKVYATGGSGNDNRNPRILVTALRMATATYQKSRGAFYTGEPVARWIVKWAVRRPGRLLLDPSCGGGVFLLSASQCLDNFLHVRPKPKACRQRPWTCRSQHFAPGSVRERGACRAVHWRVVFFAHQAQLRIGRPPFRGWNAKAGAN